VENVRDYSYEHAVRSLLSCDRCSYSVPTLVLDGHRGRAVSGYSVLQRHRDGCRGPDGTDPATLVVPVRAAC
jgi:hypothetical protein